MKITNDTQLVYVVEDEPHVGTLKDWARAQEEAFYAGLTCLTCVYVFDPETLGIRAKFPEKVDTHESSPEDYAWRSYATFRLGEAEAIVTIDLDA